MGSLKDNLELVNALESLEQRTLFDEIDKLRLYGVHEIVDLPQIVVCGDQSSGKSSVLEAISGIPFPRSQNTCTRFATEVILRTSDHSKIEGYIIRSFGNSKSNQPKKISSQQSPHNVNAVQELIEKAQFEMGIGDSGPAFSRDVLRIEISGPKKPQLTLVDLPGLIHSSTQDHTDDDIQLIKELVESYMDNPRSIILAVISASNDIPNQVVLQHRKKFDEPGERTLGLITKPDTLTRGSRKEASYVHLASSNENIKLKLGWHILKNRDDDSLTSTQEERDLSETAFFETESWKDLPKNMVGVATLRTRLSKILLDQISNHLPGLITEIQQGLSDCVSKLQKMGVGRPDFSSQQQFLFDSSQNFQQLCRAAVDGHYHDDFFGDATSVNGYQRRLRAVVQNRNMAFAQLMAKKGHRRHFTDQKFVSGTRSRPRLQPEDNVNQMTMTRNEGIKWAKTILHNSRGRELPGSFNPVLVEDLFRDQSSPWETLAEAHVDEIWEKTDKFLSKLAHHIMDDESAKSFLKHWIAPKTEARLANAKSALHELLEDRKKHPITYNHYYTDNLQQLQTDQAKSRLQRQLEMYSTPTAQGSFVLDQGQLTNLIETITQNTVKDMDDLASANLLDSMRAYYKVALKTFIDNVAIQVIEKELLWNIWTLFEPKEVAKMNKELVEKIAAESPDSQTRRKQLESKLRKLNHGIDICQRHATKTQDDISYPEIEDTEEEDEDEEDHISPTELSNNPNADEYWPKGPIQAAGELESRPAEKRELPAVNNMKPQVEGDSGTLLVDPWTGVSSQSPKAHSADVVESEEAIEEIVTKKKKSKAKKLRALLEAEQGIKLL